MSSISVKADHLMVRTPNLISSISFYERVLDMEIDSRDDRSDSKDNPYDSVFMSNKIDKSFQIEIVYNVGHDHMYDIGKAVGHLGFRTDNVDGILAKAKEYGYINRVVDHKHGLKKYRIATIYSPEGLSIAVVQKTEG